MTIGTNPVDMLQKFRLPFDVHKWDPSNSQSEPRSGTSLQFKIGCVIGIVLSVLVIAVLVICFVDTGGGNKKEYWLPSYKSTSKLGAFRHAAVSIDAAVCSPIVKQILKRNGSAVDAAIAGLLCMGVVNPQSMGIGGGFLMTVYKRDTGEAHFIDAREVAPLKATEDMFKGNTSSEIGPLSIAVPGELAGYQLAHDMFGVLNWTELFEPTIKMCREGIAVTKHLDKFLKIYSEKIKEREPMRRIFVNNVTGEVFKEGDIIYRNDLAETLQTLSVEGARALYDSTRPLARSFLRDLQDMGSIIGKEDMEKYRVRTTPPVKVPLINNDTLYSAPIPGSGSLLGFMLKVMDGYGFSADTPWNKTESVLYLHRMIETFKFAYAKRRELEDDLVAMKPLVDQFLSDKYADFVRSKIDDDYVLPNLTDYGLKEDESFAEDHGTADLSIVAPNGDAVTATSTVNVYFGSLEMSPSTGIILNDEMDDFSLPNVTSYFDVAPYSHNWIRPGRRPMSSMCPTIIVDSEGNVRMAIGANGGTKITTGVLQVITRNLLLKEDIKEAVDAPRFHHQLQPNTILSEDNFRKDLLDELRKKGHEIKDFGTGMVGIVMAIARGQDGQLYANSDYRKGGDVDGF